MRLPPTLCCIQGSISIPEFEHSRTRTAKEELSMSWLMAHQIIRIPQLPVNVSFNLLISLLDLQLSITFIFDEQVCFVEHEPGGRPRKGRVF